MNNKNADVTMWYDGHSVLTKNRLLNLIMSERGTGKSFFWKKYVCEDFLKNGHKFIYMRRYQTDIDRAKNKFFTDLNKEGYFLEHECKEEGNTFLIDSEVCGYTLPLSIASSYKSVSFGDVYTIIYEEFLIDKSEVKPLKEEPRRLLDFISTVDRYKDRVRCICLSNAIYSVNEYFDYFKIHPVDGKEFVLKEEILLQTYRNKKFTNYATKSKLGRLIDGTLYGDYALNGKFLLDDSTFIEHKTKKSTYFFGFRINQKNFAVWVDYEVGKMFVNQQYDKNRITFTFQLNDHTYNTMLLSAKKPYMLQQFILNFRQANIRYENLESKKATYDVMKLYK